MAAIHKSLSLLSCLALAAVLALVAPTPAQARKHADPFFQKTQEAVAVFDAQLRQRATSATPLLVATTQNLDDMGRSDTSGRLLGELVSSALVARGWVVQEVRLRDNLLINAQGEQLLSRNIADLVGSHEAGTAIVSTYAAAGNKIYVTLKAVRLLDGIILASHSFVVEKPSRW